MMKIGDLVKYNVDLNGLEKCLGVVIGINGGGVDVQWTDPHSRKRGVGRLAGREFSCELPDFLEVVSENR